MIWDNGEGLVEVVSDGLIPVTTSGLTSTNAQPFEEITTLRQWRRCSMGTPCQFDQAGWCARSLPVQKLHIRKTRYSYLELFWHDFTSLE